MLCCKAKPLPIGRNRLETSADTNYHENRGTGGRTWVTIPPSLQDWGATAALGIAAFKLQMRIPARLLIWDQACPAASETRTASCRCSWEQLPFWVGLVLIGAGTYRLSRIPRVRQEGQS